MLILAGAGLLITASSYRDVAERFGRWRVEDMRERDVPRLFVRLTQLTTRWGVPGAVWFGRTLGAGAIVVGVVLLVRG